MNEAIGLYLAINLCEQSRVIVHNVSLSVSGSSRSQWVIPLFTQLHEVTGPLGINMSHTEAQTNGGVVLWRRLVMEMQTIGPFSSVLNVFIFSHADAFRAHDLCGTMSPCSHELYIMDTHSKGYIWISLLPHNTAYDCELHNTGRMILFSKWAHDL